MESCVTISNHCYKQLSCSCTVINDTGQTTAMDNSASQQLANDPTDNFNQIIGYIEDIVISSEFQVSWATKWELFDAFVDFICTLKGTSAATLRKILYALYRWRRKSHLLHGYIQRLHKYNWRIRFGKIASEYGRWTNW